MKSAAPIELIWVRIDIINLLPSSKPLDKDYLYFLLVVIVEYE